MENDTLVSMNMFGFTPSFLQELAARFPTFLEKDMPLNPAKKECLLPTTVSDLLGEGKAEITVLSSADKWYGVTYAADKPLVVAALKEAANVEGILADPAMFAAVTGYGDHAINYVVRVWTTTADYWTVHFDLLEGVKKAFADNNITIPFPQMDVHIDKN